MPLSCVSAPALTEQEALEAKFFAAGSTRRGRSSSADMSPSYADESASAAFDTPDGTHVLAKRWTHPDGPRPFRPRCSPRAVVAGVPGAKKHREKAGQETEEVNRYAFFKSDLSSSVCERQDVL